VTLPSLLGSVVAGPDGVVFVAVLPATPGVQADTVRQAMAAMAASEPLRKVVRRRIRFSLVVGSALARLRAV
jgi:hypothetical protein